MVPADKLATVSRIMDLLHPLMSVEQDPEVQRFLGRANVALQSALVAYDVRSQKGLDPTSIAQELEQHR